MKFKSSLAFIGLRRSYRRDEGMCFRDKSNLLYSNWNLYYYAIHNADMHFIDDVNRVIQGRLKFMSQHGFGKNVTELMVFYTQVPPNVSKKKFLSAV